MKPSIGIDLGTTNSAVATCASGAPRIIERATGQRLLPSLVGVNEAGKRVVGEEARLLSRLSPDMVASATKRFSQLSLVFDTAVREGTIEQQGEVVRSGEQTLTTLVKELRALKPEDCKLQQDLSAVGTR